MLEFSKLCRHRHRRRRKPLRRVDIHFDDARHSRFIHRHADQLLAHLHRHLVVGDEQELGRGRHFLHQFAEAIGIGIIQRRIDRETRDLLQTTFDIVNRHFMELFPTLFGGGNAYLRLTGDEILDAGLQVFAQPPGKKNQSIQLLSGGEKALTALSLVFSLFRLNPAPFCLLDEVDAPLDEHNVGRFCDIVREMASQVQFIFITHNKSTMELASQLLGVTMNEPGVSRLVSVDVDEAVRLAAV